MLREHLAQVANQLPPIDRLPSHAAFLCIGVIAVLQRNSWRFSSKETIDGRRDVTVAAGKFGGGQMW
jgi:hypothetical protein